MNHAATARKLRREIQEVEQRIAPEHNENSAGSRAEMLQTLGHLDRIELGIKRGQILALIHYNRDGPAVTQGSDSGRFKARNKKSFVARASHDRGGRLRAVRRFRQGLIG